MPELTPMQIIEALRALPLNRRYSIVLEAGVIGQCCPLCGCYAGTCHPWSWKDSGQDCTCSANPANVVTYSHCMGCGGVVEDADRSITDSVGDQYHASCARIANAI